MPLEAIRAAGAHYLKRQGESTGVSEAELVNAAIKNLGLSDIVPFDPAAKIVEYRLRRSGALVERTLRSFTDELSSESPAPGGGSVAALLGAMAGALAAMVAALTHGKKGFEGAAAKMDAVGVEAQGLKDAFLEDVDRDTDAFHAVLAASRLPKKTPEENAARTKAMEEASLQATLVPLGVLERSLRAAELAREVAEHGNPNSLSDAGVAALCAGACAAGAHMNVLINLAGRTDASAGDLRKRADAALARAADAADAVVKQVRDRL